MAINHNTISGGHCNAPVIMAQWVNDSAPRGAGHRVGAPGVGAALTLP